MKLFLCVYRIYYGDTHSAQHTAAVLGVDLRSCQCRLQFGLPIGATAVVVTADECTNGVIPMIL